MKKIVALDKTGKLPDFGGTNGRDIQDHWGGRHGVRAGEPRRNKKLGVAGTGSARDSGLAHGSLPLGPRFRLRGTASRPGAGGGGTGPNRILRRGSSGLLATRRCLPD